MRPLAKPCAALLIFGVLTGCVTTLKPVYPTTAIEAGKPTHGVRFASEQISFAEPGVPIATGKLWQKDVAGFTAERLNILLGAPDAGAVAQTMVTFDLAAPGAFQIGSWKELTVSVTSHLPDGRVVHSSPLTAKIDSNLEFLAQQALLFGGPVFEVAAFVLGIYLFTGGVFNFVQYPWMCGCLVGLAFSGLFLNVAQAMLQWLIGLLEERRASDLYQQALVAHATDVRDVLAGRKQASPGTPDFSPDLPPALPKEAPRILPPLDHKPPPPPPPPPLIDDPAEIENDQPFLY